MDGNQLPVEATEIFARHYGSSFPLIFLVVPKKNSIRIVKKLQMTWTIRGKALIVAKNWNDTFILAFNALCEYTCCQEFVQART